MSTLQPAQAPSMETQQAQQGQENNANQITGIPEIDAALVSLMEVLPKKGAPQLEALVQALEATLGGQKQEEGAEAGAMPQGQQGQPQPMPVSGPGA